MVCGNYQLTVQMLKSQLNIKKDSVCEIIIEDFIMSKRETEKENEEEIRGRKGE